MAKRGKKHRKARESVDFSQRYEFADGVKIALECAFTRFDESVDLAVRLGVDPRRADQMVRGHCGASKWYREISTSPGLRQG